MAPQTTNYQKYDAGLYSWEKRQFEPFTGTLQGVRGGGTNPVVRMGLGLRGHHLQAGSEDAESRGCETGLQITVWRADAVTFCLLAACHSFCHRLEHHVLSLWLHHTESARAESDQTQQHQQCIHHAWTALIQ